MKKVWIFLVELFESAGLSKLDLLLGCIAVFVSVVALRLMQISYESVCAGVIEKSMHVRVVMVWSSLTAVSWLAFLVKILACHYWECQSDMGEK